MGGARREHADVTGSAVTAEVGVGPDGQGGYGLAVVLDVELAGLDQRAAEDVVAQAHRVCPYSAATRGNIEVTLRTTVV